MDEIEFANSEEFKEQKRLNETYPFLLGIVISRKEIRDILKRMDENKELTVCFPYSQEVKDCCFNKHITMKDFV